MEAASSGVNLDWLVWYDSGLAPSGCHVPVGLEHVVGKEFAKAVCRRGLRLRCRAVSLGDSEIFRLYKDHTQLRLT